MVYGRATPEAAGSDDGNQDPKSLRLLASIITSREVVPGNGALGQLSIADLGDFVAHETERLTQLFRELQEQ